MTEFVTLPGIGGSGPAHWQSHWEAEYPAMQRFSPASWDEPALEDWLAALDRAVLRTTEPPVLIAHSLACLLVAHWAARPHPPIRGAFLVAPPDPEGAGFPSAAASFREIPMSALPFPSLIVASEDDPYGPLVHSRQCAAAWGSGIVIVGRAGHINSDSDLGCWPQGWMLLNAFWAGCAKR